MNEESEAEDAGPVLVARKPFRHCQTAFELRLYEEGLLGIFQLGAFGAERLVAEGAVKTEGDLPVIEWLSGNHGLLVRATEVVNTLVRSIIAKKVGIEVSPNYHSPGDEDE